MQERAFGDFENLKMLLDLPSAVCPSGPSGCSVSPDPTTRNIYQLTINMGYMYSVHGPLEIFIGQKLNSQSLSTAKIRSFSEK